MITGKLLRVGGMRGCYSPAYTPLGYILKGGDVALHYIPPGGIFSRGGGHGPHAGQGVVTEVWGTTWIGDERIIDVHIGNLHCKHGSNTRGRGGAGPD